jgi:anti-anti-sigma factor
MKRKPSLCATIVPEPTSAEQTIILKGRMLGTPECYELLETIRDGVRDGLSRVVMDMKQVDMINSAGVGIIAAIITSANNQGGQLVLVGLQDRCRQVLEIMHLHQFAEISDSDPQSDSAAT